MQPMDGGDCHSLSNTLDEAERRLGEEEANPREVVAHKGCHSNRMMTRVRDRGLRSYVSELNRGRRNWGRNRDARKPTYDNCRPTRRNRGKRLLHQPGGSLERALAHLLGDRRAALRRLDSSG